MTPRSRPLLAAILCIVPASLVTALLVRAQWGYATTSYLSISARSTATDVAWVIFDLGRNFSSRSTAESPISGETEFNTLKFPIPDETVYGIRLCPFSQPGCLTVREVRIIDGFHGTVRRIPLGSLFPVQQISRVIDGDEDRQFRTQINANAPAIGIPLAEPLNPGLTSRSLAHLALVGLGGFIGTSLALVLAALSLRAGARAVRGVVRRVQADLTGVSPRRRRANLAVLGVSVLCAVALAYPIYSMLRRPQKPVTYLGHGDEYALSFYNQQGLPVTPRTGTLKLVMDPFTLYRTYPNQKARSYTITTEGFRATPFDSAKSKEACVVGGSAAFGQGLSTDDQTFAWLLSDLNPDYNVINAAVVGFASGQELAQIVHYLDQRRPALYIVFDGWNDIVGACVAVQGNRVYRSAVDFNAQFFQIEDRLAECYRTAQGTHEDPRRLPPLSGPSGIAEHFRSAHRAYCANLDRISAFAESRDAGVLVVFQPELGNKHALSSEEDDMLAYARRSPPYADREVPERYCELVDVAMSFCEAAGIACVDLNSVPDFSDDPRTLFFDTVHPNALGHRIIARVIDRTLRERGACRRGRGLG